MTLRFAVVHEADADFRLATELADRVLVEAVDWLDKDQLPFQRDWIGAIEKDRLTWKSISQLALTAKVRATGHFEGDPGLADARAARRAILYLSKMMSDITAIMLIRDQDDQPERRQGLEQARTVYQKAETKPRVIIGFAIPEREAWVIAGFEPLNQDEQTRLDAERQSLGFYPNEQSHQLTACKNDTAPRSPKRVLRSLTMGHFERERACWSATPLALLRQRGAHNGLTSFLDEVRFLLAPLVGHVRKIDQA